ncbi:MAG: alkanesulfonate monooxygenase SsuD [Gammaproteobacteria bacterium]|jgi:alkanesulfonate monooxygenase SsuD/methylene tetrahydromethanopterin reductase-like flavin-dependent oxidoreductase (luciferase family)
MKFGNFLFPLAMSAQDDGRVIDETLKEAQLCDALGMDMVWLAEHHFDGICAYVDPVAFAAALATSTQQIRIGFAVAQMSLHHPIRMAEQMSLIDNLSKGRVLVGLGRGTAYNIYDYQGYGLDPAQAQARLLESEAIMLGAWTTENFEHVGEFWQLKLPALRPRPFTQPHPAVIRACSGEASMVEQAREGRPFLMNVQTNEITRARMVLYRQTLNENGYGDEHIAQCVDQSWVWRNVFVAETTAQAQRIARPAFETQLAFRHEMRDRVYREQGVRMKNEASPPARAQTDHAMLCGDPETVVNAIREVDEIGVGGMILQFRLGPMSYEDTERSIRLFMDEVAPHFQ